MIKRGKKDLYIAFIDKFPDLSDYKVDPDMYTIQIQQNEDKELLEKNARGLAEIFRTNPNDVQIVKIHMPTEEYEKLLGKYHLNSHCNKQMRDAFLSLNATYRPKAPSLRDITVKKLKDTLGEKDHPENPKNINTLFESPVEIRELFFKNKKSLERKAKPKIGNKQSLSEMEREAKNKPSTLRRKK